jgi:hypothetical protein
MDWELVTIAIMGIDDLSPTFQCVGAVVLGNSDKKMSNTASLDEKSAHASEPNSTILARVHNTPAWNGIREPPLEKRVSPRTVINPAEAEGFQEIFAAGDMRVDLRSELWEAYHLIFEDRYSWDDNYLQICHRVARYEKSLRTNWSH